MLKEFVGLETWAYLRDDNGKHKKAKGTKKFVVERGLMFKNYKFCQSNNETILKSQQRFKSGDHNVYTEQINKIVLSGSDNKRSQTFDKKYSLSI